MFMDGFMMFWKMIITAKKTHTLYITSQETAMIDKI
jgi:hypothetical protein